MDEAAVDIGAWCSWLEKETYLIGGNERTVLINIEVRHLEHGFFLMGFGVDVSMSGRCCVMKIVRLSAGMINPTFGR
jgi:hypothetical protein